MAKEDAISLLKADHRKVEDLFEQYEKSRGKKSAIALQICTELTVHAMIEEELFYPACVEAVDEDKLNEAYVEHDGAKVLIADLSAGSPEDDFYDAKMKVLSEEIKHHVKEEEKRDGIFAQFRASGADLVDLGEKLKARKAELLSSFKKDGLPKPVTTTLNVAKI